MSVEAWTIIFLVGWMFLVLGLIAISEWWFYSSCRKIDRKSIQKIERMR